MNTRPFRLVPEIFTDDQQEQPMRDDQTTSPYAPEALPALESLEHLGATIEAYARNMKTSGQMIVHDLRRQRQSLDREADVLEQERLDEIDHINDSYRNKMARNRMMAGDVDGMIAHYTAAIPPAQEQQEPEQLQPPRRRQGLLARIVG